jgi:hypothetical protein
MSVKERDRLKVMASLKAKRVKQVEAARLLRLALAMQDAIGRMSAPSWP